MKKLKVLNKKIYILLILNKLFLVKKLFAYTNVLMNMPLIELFHIGKFYIFKRFNHGTL